MADWKTPQRGAACAGTQRPFEEGERIYSVLRLTDEGLVREDFSEAYFTAREEQPEAEIVWWRTVHQVERKRGLALDFDAIEGLFDALGKRDDERSGELRYVVCLLLLRKRRLKMVRVKRATDGEAMVVRRPRRTEEHEVSVFDLTPERADALRRDLQALFEGAELGEGALDAGGETQPAAESDADEEGQKPAAGEGQSSDSPEAQGDDAPTDPQPAGAE